MTIAIAALHNNEGAQSRSVAEEMSQAGSREPGLSPRMKELGHAGAMGISEDSGRIDFDLKRHIHILQLDEWHMVS